MIPLLPQHAHRAPCALLILVALASLLASAAGAAEIAPLSDTRYSARTVTVALEVDRDGARVVAYTVKPRPFDASLEIEPPRSYDDQQPVQFEVVLQGAAGQSYTRRVDVSGLCLAHPAGTAPHVAGDTIRLHRETFVVEMPERAGLDRVEIAYYQDDSGLPLRRSLGSGNLDAPSFRRAGGSILYTEVAFARSDSGDATASTMASTAMWPEDFDDEDIYLVFGNEADSARRINVVIVPDGYTYAEKALMEAHAADMVSYFRGVRPYEEHDPFMNYTLVYAYSVESGTDQCDCGIVLDTAMGTHFPLSNPSCGNSANRCLFYDYGGEGTCDSSGTPNIAEAELRAPAQDTTVVMVNTTRYGGCGGDRAVYSAGNSSATDVAVHELGHSLAGLADEYESNSACGSLAGERNTSTNSSQGAWPEWISEIGPPRQGGQYYSQCIYRPLQNCEMRSLFQPFCPVCNQRWSLLTFGHPRVAPTAPVESFTPASPLTVESWGEAEFSVATRFSQGPVVTNSIVWSVAPPGGSLVAVASGSTTHTQAFGAEGLYELEVEVVADTNFVKPEKYGSNRDTVTWSVEVVASAPPQEVSPPSSIDPLLFLGKSRISWEPPVASGTTTFNVYSGLVSALPASYGVCQWSGLVDNESLVLGPVPPGAARFWIVTGSNSVGEGPLGTTSSGAPRTNTAPCN